jgi:hypothetical protein
MKRITFAAGLALALALAWTGTALAAKPRVGVPKFEGPQEALVRKRVMQVLKSQGYDLVKSREIEGTGISLDSNDGFRALAKELALSAIVTGELSPKKARLAVRDGSDGSVSGEGSFAGANPRKVAAEVGKSFWRRLGSAVERGKVPAGAKKPQASAVAEAPEDKEDAPDAAGDDDSGDKDKSSDDKPSKTTAKRESDDSGSSSSSSSDEDADRPRKRRKKAATEVVEEESSPGTPSEYSWLEAGVGGRGFSRNLLYHQDIAAALRQYQLNTGPAAVADIVFYPLAIAGGGPAANIGVEVGIEQAFGITSRVGMSTAFPQGATFPTVIHDYYAGARYRLPLGEHELAFLAGGGEHAYAFRSNGSADRTLLDLPDTIYRYARAGLEARFALPYGVSILAGGGYRYILNGGGQIKDTFFPHLTVQGVDANLGVAYKVTPMIEARLVGDLRRYFYDMHSVMSDRLLAGGAVDQYISVTGMLAFMLGGEHKNSAEAEPAPDMGKEKSRPEAGGERDE